jgi:hypothetical protein
MIPSSTRAYPLIGGRLRATVVPVPLPAGNVEELKPSGWVLVVSTTPSTGSTVAQNPSQVVELLLTKKGQVEYVTVHRLIPVPGGQPPAGHM